jgi:hypothetical protein
MLVIKVRSEKLPGERIRDTIFIGEKGQTLQNAGSIILRVGEWQMFGALLLMGAEQVRRHRSPQGVEPDVEVVTEGWKPE